MQPVEMKRVMHPIVKHPVAVKPVVVQFSVVPPLMLSFVMHPVMVRLLWCSL